MDRIFYSPTQYAKEIKKMNPSTTQINYFIDFENIRESKDFDNYYVKPIAIKIIGASEDKNENKDIMLNLSKQIYARMKLYNEHRDDSGVFMCLRTDCTQEKIYSAIDGEHTFYSSKVLTVPNETPLAEQLYNLVNEQNEEKQSHIESIENNFTL